MDAVFVYITTAGPEEAETIAKALLKKRLIACANIMAPHRSVYRWEGWVQQETETAMILKTRAALFEQVESTVKALHSYDCPCIVALPVVSGHAPFLDWIAGETE